MMFFLADLFAFRENVSALDALEKLSSCFAGIQRKKFFFSYIERQVEQKERLLQKLFDPPEVHLKPIC